MKYLMPRRVLQGQKNASREKERSGKETARNKRANCRTIGWYGDVGERSEYGSRSRRDVIPGNQQPDGGRPDNIYKKQTSCEKITKDRKEEQLKRKKRIFKPMDEIGRGTRKKPNILITATDRKRKRSGWREIEGTTMERDRGKKLTESGRAKPS